MMQIEQSIVKLSPKPRGVHLVTDEILSKIEFVSKYKSAILHFFLRHTSAALTINESMDPDVRIDTNTFLNNLVPDGYKGFYHTLEGADDMPAHIKSMLLGVNLSIPVFSGKMMLGSWQGIYLVEPRESSGSREIVVTVLGSVI